MTDKLLRYLLRPALRVCLRRGWGAAEVIDAAKRELLLLADAELERSGEKRSVSRLAVMTGLNRKEITRMLDPDRSAASTSQSILARVLGQWSNDERFLTARGKPKVLTFGADDSDFTTLVRDVTSDVGAAAVLSELERLGAVHLAPTGARLIEREHILEASPERVFDLLSRDIDTLVAAVEENFNEEPDPRNPHSRTEYDNIFIDDLPAIRVWLLRESARFHERLRRYLSKYDKDLSPTRDGKAGGRVVFSSFGWTQPCPPKRPKQG